MTKATSPLLQQKRTEMINRILDTAREIMRSEGVAALSMQELARRMHMRAPSLYNYFASKTEIYDSLFQLGFHKFDEHLRSLALTGDHWQTDIPTLMEGYMVFALQNPELYQLCFERPVPGFEPSAQSMQLSFGILQRYYAQVKNWLPLMNTELDEYQLTDLMIAIMHGLTALHLANQPELPQGEGRFGSLIPSVVHFLDKALSK
ncbi:MAG: TetR/AcrR family transcriptional regulator [Anaerolineaceae bacterium]|jgi:AcrR family transcriptional regulator|nr:TetR/AcrR family transcriptional regulator [Anaerolineaceae bacterium]